MTYQFEHEPINDCHNFSTQEECPMFEFVCDGGFCNLSRKWIYEEFDELPEGVPEWCELVRVIRSIDYLEEEYDAERI